VELSDVANLLRVVEFKGVVRGVGTSNEQSRKKGVEREPGETKEGLGGESFVAHFSQFVL